MNVAIEMKLDRIKTLRELAQQAKISGKFIRQHNTWYTVDEFLDEVNAYELSTTFYAPFEPSLCAIENPANHLFLLYHQAIDSIRQVQHFRRRMKIHEDDHLEEAIQHFKLYDVPSPKPGE